MAKKSKIDSIHTGDKFERWTVIEKKDKSSIICRCDCGSEKAVYGWNLLSGKSKSCGCLSAELAKEREKTHGKNKTKEHAIWVSMRNRCRGNGTNSFYYTERGITIDPRWDKFENFLEDMGECPDGLTLDRIDNRLGYSKENCQWANCSQQSSNKRKSTLNTSGRIGVMWAEDRKRWRVNLKVNGVMHNIGSFKSYEAACDACTAAELSLLGYSREDY